MLCVNISYLLCCTCGYWALCSAIYTSCIYRILSNSGSGLFHEKCSKLYKKSCWCSYLVPLDNQKQYITTLFRTFKKKLIKAKVGGYTITESSIIRKNMVCTNGTVFVLGIDNPFPYICLTGQVAVWLTVSYWLIVYTNMLQLKIYFSWFTSIIDLKGSMAWVSTLLSAHLVEYQICRCAICLILLQGEVSDSVNFMAHSGEVF